MKTTEIKFHDIKPGDKIVICKEPTNITSWMWIINVTKEYESFYEKTDITKSITYVDAWESGHNPNQYNVERCELNISRKCKFWRLESDN
jgi:hypothetical protein